MATAIDDIRPGQYLMLNDKHDDAEPFDMFGSWGRPRRRRNEGVPCRVLAVSPPFLAIEAQGRRLSIDAREVEILRVDRRFVEALNESKPIPTAAKPKRKRKEKPDPRCCVRCGTRLVQRLICQPGDSHWVPLCKGCGWTGERVEK